VVDGAVDAAACDAAGWLFAGAAAERAGAVPVDGATAAGALAAAVRAGAAPLAVAELPAFAVLVAGAVTAAGAGAAAVAADSAGAAGAATLVLAGAVSTTPAFGAAVGVAGVPKPAGVHAQARPAPTAATLNSDKTAKPIIRTCLGTCSSKDSRRTNLGDDDTVVCTP
jgi:hypothetical protein